MSSSHFQLGPLHLCDYLLRSDLGISSVAIEIAPGYTSPGSHLRDLFEFSRLLDLYSLLNVPLHLHMAVPSATGPDPKADPTIHVDVAQWPVPPDETTSVHLGGPLAGPWAGQTVRPIRDLAAGQRRATPCLSRTPGSSVPTNTPKPLFPWLQSLAPGRHRMRTRCHREDRSVILSGSQSLGEPGP